MTSSVIPNLSELAAAGVVAACVLGGVAMVVAFWLRRRWGKLRRLLIGPARSLADDAGSAWWRWLWSQPLPDRRWLSMHRARRRLWRALAGAEHGVAMARSSGAPLGDLVSLCRRLRQAVCDIDRSLRLAQRSTGILIDIDAIVRQAGDLTYSACLIQQAAALSLASISEPTTIDLVGDVHQELAAMTGGMGHASRRSAPLATRD
jgi:hypothetical protein